MWLPCMKNDIIITITIIITTIITNINKVVGSGSSSTLYLH